VKTSNLTCNNNYPCAEFALLTSIPIRKVGNSNPVGTITPHTSQNRNSISGNKRRDFYAVNSKSLDTGGRRGVLFWGGSEIQASAAEAVSEQLYRHRMLLEGNSAMV
jgi:hypothetical protein